MTTYIIISIICFFPVVVWLMIPNDKKQLNFKGAWHNIIYGLMLAATFNAFLAAIAFVIFFHSK